jgi:aminoglycoside 3-N-acetyltransferase
MTATIALKARVKKSLRRARSLYAKTFQSFEPADLERVLRDLGVAAGDTLLLHSSFDAFAGFTGKPTDALAVLQKLISTNGILMVPTLPFTGTAVGYAQGDPVFDPARTPSRMGLLTELFRRMPNVVRSIHPTHAVAAWGKDAAAIVADHYLARTPCGDGTPYARLLERRGKILLLGVAIDSLTFYHTIEELLEPRFPVSPFTQDTYRLKSRARDGTLIETETRLFEPSVSKRRNLFKLVPYLKQRGAWREKHLGRMDIVLLNAQDVLDAARAMADKAEFCYD